MKVRRQRVRSSLSLLAGALALAFVWWGGGKLYAGAKNLTLQVRRPSWSYWRAGGLKVAGLPEAQSLRVAEFAAPVPGKIYLSTDCAHLCSDIKDAFPELREVGVSRNWLTRKMVVQAVPRRPVGLFVAAAEQAYLDDNGELYSVSGDTESISVPVVKLAALPAGRKVPQEMSALLSYINSNSASFPSVPVELQQSGREGPLSLKLSDGSIVDWGSFAYASEKLEKLRAIFAVAKARINGPLRINMLNFEDGNIPVRALDPSGG